MKLRERALNLLARREHSRAELEKKLARFLDDEGAADELAAVLDQLERDNLLSDVRYAEALANARGGRHGSLRLKADLREKGVPAAVTAEVLAGARENDLEAARAVWRRKFGEIANDAAARAKQMRFLSSRGFPAEIVRRVVGGDED